MYDIQSTATLKRSLSAGRLRSRVGSTVLLLGTCSLLTDISSEMVSAILPIYLVATLGFSPLQYGIVDCLYQGPVGTKLKVTCPIDVGGKKVTMTRFLTLVGEDRRSRRCVVAAVAFDRHEQIVVTVARHVGSSEG